MSKRMRPQTYHAGLAFAFTVAGVAILYAIFRLPWTWYHLLAAWLGVINLVALAYYGHDKVQARAQRSRVPEVVLHGLTFAGGSFGAYLGMRLFRHKTVKPSFRLMFWIIIVLQFLLVLAIVYRVWKHG